MTYFELKKYLTEKLFSICPNEAEREAIIMIEHACGLDRGHIVSRYKEPVSEKTEKDTKCMLEARLKRVPLAYITGKTGFMGYTIQCRQGVLIPRPDTETVCEKAMELLPEKAHVADVCCGSGCIGLSLAKKKNATADLFDISREAILLSTINAKGLGVEDRVRILNRNLFDNDFFDGCEKYNLIISNPPYIKTEEISTLSPEVQKEPKWALDGGRDGMLFYRRLLKVCPPYIKEGGHLVLEIGYDQGQEITDLCKGKGYSCKVYKDYGNNDRICVVDF